MKKTLITVIFALMALACFAQDGGPLKFLGIPVDGTEAQFATKLKAKGFTYNAFFESYKGQFNGKPVDVYIHTNHDKVDRVYVAFPFTSETEITTEYNRLLGQFKNNAKYMDLSMNEEIPSDENIYYEILINKKRYQAGFSYFDPDRDGAELMNAMLDTVSEFFTDEQLARLRQYCLKALGASEDEQQELMAKLTADMQAMGLGQETNGSLDEDRSVRFVLALMDGMKSLADGEVWFMIHEHYGDYQIGLYYDNLHNQAHGEDL